MSSGIHIHDDDVELYAAGRLETERILSQEDLDTLVDLLRVRPIQFCMFLAALFGEEQMETMMSSSVQQVKTLRATRRKSLGREAELGEEESVGHGMIDGNRDEELMRMAVDLSRQSQAEDDGRIH